MAHLAREHLGELVRQKLLKNLKRWLKHYNNFGGKMLNESRSGMMSEDELAIAESEGVKKIIGHPERTDNLVEEVVTLGGSAENILPKEMYQRIVELQNKIDQEGPLPAALNNELVHLQ